MAGLNRFYEKTEPFPRFPSICDLEIPLYANQKDGLNMTIKAR
jgi:hypothetical protein